MAFTCLDGSFGGIASMDVGRDALKVNSVLLESLFQEFGAFVVNYVKVRGLSVVL